MVCFVNLFLAALTLVAAQAGQQCDEGWFTNGDSCYLLDNKHALYEEGPMFYTARKSCDDNNAELAEITSVEENAYIREWLAATNQDTTRGVWIGGNRLQSDQWQWASSKTDVNFTIIDLVRKPKPWEKCISMDQSSVYSWVPEYCYRGKNMKYLCEQQICKLPDQCFQGSCYSLSCAIFAPKLVQMYQVEDYEDGKFPKTYKCPKGSLVRIESKEENEFIKKFLSGADDYVQNVWTAGYDEINEWKWQDTDAAVTFEDWAPKEDDEDDDYFERYDQSYASTTAGWIDYYEAENSEKCIYLSREDNWAWKEQECMFKYPILCEYPDEEFELRDQ